MKAEMLPCPFCGGVAVLEGGSYLEYHGRSHMDVWVECKECGARGPEAEDTDPDSLDYAEMAITGWSRRERADL